MWVLFFFFNLKEAPQTRLKETVIVSSPDLGLNVSAAFP